MGFAEHLLNLAKAVRLKDWQEAELAVDTIARDISDFTDELQEDSGLAIEVAEAIAKGRADAETKLRRALRESGIEFAPVVDDERAAA